MFRHTKIDTYHIHHTGKKILELRWKSLLKIPHLGVLKRYVLNLHVGFYLDSLYRSKYYTIIKQSFALQMYDERQYVISDVKCVLNLNFFMLFFINEGLIYFEAHRNALYQMQLNKCIT